jgi:hypothetical protein
MNTPIIARSEELENVAPKECIPVVICGQTLALAESYSMPGGTKRQ